MSYPSMPNESHAAATGSDAGPASTLARLQYPYVFSWRFDFQHPIEEVWDFITNTDRLDRAAKLPPVRYTDRPRSDGGSLRFGEQKMLWYKLRWLEYPYEWVRYRYLRNQRAYEGGPLQSFLIHWDFKPTETGCRLEQFIAVKPSNWVSGQVARMQVGVFTRNAFLEAYAYLDHYLSHREPDPFKPGPEDEFRPPPGLRDQTIRRLTAAAAMPELSERATDFILQSAPAALVRLRPLRLAKLWGIPDLDAVIFFLRGTKAGVFTMAWDLLCPNCRGAKVSVANLADIAQQAHCESCNISYNGDFDKSVELTFEVSPTVRVVDVPQYCAGGPQNTPHYLAQLRVPAAQEWNGTIGLEAGSYIVRSPQTKRRCRLDVAKSSARLEQLGIDFFSDGSEETSVFKTSPGNCHFVLRNSSGNEVVFIVERAEWLEDVCTAAYVTSLQEFRDLFDTQLLRRGEGLSVGAMALFFTDLKGSTALYERVGDGQAFALVDEHFAILMDEVRGQGGSVVKTIGDAVMAVFTQPAAALNAALCIQRRIVEYNRQPSLTEPLTLKIGLHYGACLAVNFNERMDYFGSAVNLAARIEGQCEGGDIVMSQIMYEYPGIAEIANALKTESFRRSLKGIEHEVPLVRIRL